MFLHSTHYCSLPRSESHFLKKARWKLHKDASCCFEKKILQLYGHIPSILDTIQVRRVSQVEHLSRSKDELISDVLLLTPTHEPISVGRSAIAYIHQLCADTGHHLEDLTKVTIEWDRERERERARESERERESERRAKREEREREY